MIKSHKAINLSNDLAFGGYQPNGLSVGKEGSSEGFIVDLGERSNVMQRYEYAETIGRTQGFSSIHIESGEFVILKDRKEGTFQPIIEAAALFDGSALEDADVHIGHIYLIRIKPKREDETGLLVKLIVLDHSPGASATVRWEVLE